MQANHPKFHGVQPTLALHDEHWQQDGFRAALPDFAKRLNPNLSVHLVPQVKPLNCSMMLAIGDRWCNRVQRELFTRNPKSRVGRFLLIAEHHYTVGWHLHGVGWLPENLMFRCSSNAARWLAEETLHYLPHVGVAVERFPESSAIVNAATGDAVQKTMRYASKRWISGSKFDAVVLNGRFYQTSTEQHLPSA